MFAKLNKLNKKKLTVSYSIRSHNGVFYCKVTITIPACLAYLCELV